MSLFFVLNDCHDKKYEPIKGTERPRNVLRMFASNTSNNTNDVRFSLNTSLEHYI